MSKADAAPDLVYFTLDLTDSGTCKRVEQFEHGGFSPVVFGFRRNRINASYTPPWPHVFLGTTRDENYWHRILATFASLGILIANRRYVQRAQVFYARNLDQLLLALFAKLLFNHQANLVYEVMDIRPLFVGQGIVSRLARSVERWCLRHIRLLVLSSPGFYRNYFTKVQGYTGDWFLFENKLHHSALSLRFERSARRDPGRGKPWVVGYFGTIRGDQTLDLMVRMVERLGDKVQFVFRGILTAVDRARFAAVLAEHPNITYGGEYVNPRDLAALYSEVDFAWAIDLEHADHNSRWLLPCRFYEAGLFGVPCLAAKDFEVGNLIERLDAGWTVGEPYDEALVRFFETLTPEAYEDKCRILAALPTSVFVTDTDTRALARVLRGFKAGTVVTDAIAGN
jgi:succinoglycan biosynthesis protein ExoL